MKAGPFWSWVLKSLGGVGIAMPWGVAYILPDYFDDESVHVHEREHLDQIKRLGPVWFTLKYLGLLCWYGYGMHPMEVEARQREIYGVTPRMLKERKGAQP